MLIRVVLSLFLLLLPVSLSAQTVPTSSAQISLSFAPIVQQVMPSVVNIYTKRVVRERVAASPFLNDPIFQQFFGNNPVFAGPVQERERVEKSLGSGVIIHQDGTIVTAHHVIKDAQEINVVLSDRREFAATVTKRDPQTDLAFLTIKAAAPLPTLRLRDSDTLEVGELVLALGNPFGLGGSVSQGIISALSRSGAKGGSAYQSFIQTDAAINPGNSGGALVDMQGRLIGINTAIFSTSGGSNGIGFAIPATMVRAIATSAVREDGNIIRPWLGVEVQPVTAEMANSLAMATPRGVLIRDVTKSSPAASAGLQQGDVLLTLDEAPINDAQDLAYRTGTARAGQTVTLTYIRGGREQSAQATLATPPKIAHDKRVLTGKNPLAGLEVVTLTPELTAQLNVAPGVTPSGVLVLGGRTQGMSAFAPGDVIQLVNGKAVASTEALQTLLSQASRNWDIAFQRGGNRLTLSIRQ